MFRVIVAGLGVALGAPLFAQPSPEVAFSGTIRTRFESWQWFEGDADPSYRFLGSFVRLAASQQRDCYDWHVEFMAPILLGLPENAIGPGVQGQGGMGASYFAASGGARNAANLFPKQAFVRLKGGAHSLRLGRFEFSDGGEVAPPHAALAAVKRDRVNQRLVGPFGFTHVGRAFDGGHYLYQKGSTNVTALSVMPTRGVFQTNGWGNLKISLTYGSVTRQVRNGEWRAFGIFYYDPRDVLKVDNRPLPVRAADRESLRLGTFGGHWLQAAGPIDILLWGAAQTGRWGRLDHRAAAFNGEAGYQPPVLPRLKPWIRAGYAHATGDRDPNDSRQGTFFQVMPTPRPFARFPFFNMMNHDDVFAMLILRPHAQVTVSAEAHSLRLASRRDLWYLGGGAFQPNTFGYVGRPAGGSRSLATLWDLNLEYRVNREITLTAFGAVARGRSVPEAIYRRDKNAFYGYLEMLYRF
ncbi:MAG: alginate export family protein [Bryobacterales bacterium]|nr:alginate export family protein [Bryobacterales bacterium]